MKKLFSSLIAISMMLTVLPVAMAYSGYQEFTYNGESHYLAREESLVGCANDCPYYFLRTNPLLSGDSEQYLYGYGYGYFAETGYGYGYGFGYGYDYWDSYVSSWVSTGSYAKLGIGLGESYGEFKIPTSRGVTMALPTSMTFES